MTSDAIMAILREQIKRDEGYRSKPYLDTADKLTIGYGRNLTDRGISQAEASLMLDTDLAVGISEAIKLYEYMMRTIAGKWVKLTPARRIVLANMSFNIGYSKLKRFPKMWRALIEKNYEIAADEMLDSLWARQVKGRAQRLAKLMRTGEFHD